MKVSSFILATQNPGKLVEFQLFLSEKLMDFPLKNLDSLAERVESPEENGTTFAENAVIKALYYNRYCPEDSCVIAEDSGLSVDHLNGAPGIFSARFAGEQCDDGQNIDKLLRMMNGAKQRDAHFMTVIALACAGKIITTFTGAVYGQIAIRRNGNNGFGYDPIFYYPPLKRCFAELSAFEKNQVSHRSKAMFALRHFLLQMTFNEKKK